MPPEDASANSNTTRDGTRLDRGHTGVPLGQAPSTDVVLHPLKADILAPIARARSLLNGGMASSLGLHPAARRHRHRRIVGAADGRSRREAAVQVATVDIAARGLPSLAAARSSPRGWASASPAPASRATGTTARKSSATRSNSRATAPSAATARPMEPKTSSPRPWATRCWLNENDRVSPPAFRPRSQRPRD